MSQENSINKLFTHIEIAKHNFIYQKGKNLEDFSILINENTENAIKEFYSEFKCGTIAGLDIVYDSRIECYAFVLVEKVFELEV